MAFVAEHQARRKGSSGSEDVEGSVREGAPRRVISLCTVLRLVGIEVKLQALSGFCF